MILMNHLNNLLKYISLNQTVKSPRFRELSHGRPIVKNRPHVLTQSPEIAHCATIVPHMRPIK